MKIVKVTSIPKLLIKISLILVVIFIALNFNQLIPVAREKFRQYFTYSLCDRSKTYKIGFIDPRFGVSGEAFTRDTQEAARIWNSADNGKTLLMFTPSDKDSLVINLVYDKRTDLNNQINNLQGQVKEKDQSLQTGIDQYQKLSADFEKKLADFNARAKALNEQIDSWNQKGGAPTDIYEQLVKQQAQLSNEQTSLQAQADSLNQTARELNLSTKDYNSNVSQLNNTIYSFNEALSQKPEEGIYNPNTQAIDIYFNNNHSELIHTLAHEMGHAFGLSHNNNRQSIMYPYSTQTTTLSTQDLASLQTLCSNRIFDLPYQAQLQPLFGAIKSLTGLAL